MKLRMTAIALLVAALSTGAYAQSSRIDERQAEHQKRIERGVKSGELTKQEAERLQKGQARIQSMEDKARADGKITREERRRIEYAQDRESQRIRRETHNKETAKSASPSRIDQRQAEQQRRIDQGVKSGQLTDKEAARLQKGQARVQKMEDKARADGKITAEERRRIEHTQDQQSKKIYREMHDKQTAPK